jgi:hypothetical protein
MEPSAEMTRPQFVIPPLGGLLHSPPKGRTTNQVARGWCFSLILLLLVSPGLAFSQQTNAPAITTVTNTVADHPSESSTDQWSFSASVIGYLVPHSRDYVNPNFTADRGWLHLEARYNYEALESGSLWVGDNFSLGDKLVLDFTPMVGGVFGDLIGVAPGWNLSLSYKRFTLASQNEYVFDTRDSSGNFFYTWSELSYSPWDWLRVGLVAQRTKAYQSSLDIQRGFLVGVTYKKVDLTAYVFNLGWTDPTLVLAVGLNF